MQKENSKKLYLGLIMLSMVAIPFIANTQHSKAINAGSGSGNANWRGTYLSGESNYIKIKNLSGQVVNINKYKKFSTYQTNGHPDICTGQTYYNTDHRGSDKRFKVR